jgi:hypothetical protein
MQHVKCQQFVTMVIQNSVISKLSSHCYITIYNIKDYWICTCREGTLHWYYKMGRKLKWKIYYSHERLYEINELFWAITSSCSLTQCHKQLAQHEFDSHANLIFYADKWHFNGSTNNPSHWQCCENIQIYIYIYKLKTCHSVNTLSSYNCARKKLKRKRLGTVGQVSFHSPSLY